MSRHRSGPPVLVRFLGGALVGVVVLGAVRSALADNVAGPAVAAAGGLSTVRATMAELAGSIESDAPPKTPGRPPTDDESTPTPSPQQSPVPDRDETALTVGLPAMIGQALPPGDEPSDPSPSPDESSEPSPAPPLSPSKPAPTGNPTTGDPDPGAVSPGNSGGKGEGAKRGHRFPPGHPLRAD